MRGRLPPHPRTTLALLLLCAAALAAPGASLVDGTELEGARLVDGDASAVRLEVGGQVRVVPAARLVAIDLPEPPATDEQGFNLYLRNGDRLRGRVAGAAGGITLESARIGGFAVPIDAVRGVRFGRIVAVHLQGRYAEAFERELERGRDVIVAIRDAHPTPFPARVLEVGEGSLKARVGSERQELPADRVYGFVRADEGDLPPAEGVRVRVHLAGGERVTLPLDRITETHVEGGGAKVDRNAALRIEFVGPHIVHLSDLDPIDVQQAALFGEAPPWRRDGMVLGGPLRVAGRTFARGVGVQARSRLEFVLQGRWDALFLRCGIDDAAGPEGDAVFRVLGDGKVLAEVRRRHREPALPLRLDIKGVERLVLEAVPGESWVSDFCDWAEARVYAAGAPRGG